MGRKIREKRGDGGVLDDDDDEGDSCRTVEGNEGLSAVYREAVGSF